MFQFGDDFAAFLTAVELEVDLPLYIAAFGALAAQFFSKRRTRPSLRVRRASMPLRIHASS